MGLLEDIGVRLWRILGFDNITDQERRERMETMLLHASYYDGEHQEQFKVKPNQPDYNLTLNFVRLVVDRSVALLVGGGIEFDLPGEGDDLPNQVYIDEVWRANRKDLALHKGAQLASIYGTGYAKIVIDGAESKDNENKRVPRIIFLDPRYMTIVTDPEDIETVDAYVTEFNIYDKDGKEIRRKEVTERNLGADGQTMSWTITNYKHEGRSWEIIGSPVDWPYEFAPIVHWKNLPQPSSEYGESDIKDLIVLQNEINLIAGNIGKILYLHAHPRTIGIGFGPEDLRGIDGGPDSFWTINKTDASVTNLEMQSDLVSSQQFLMFMRQALFDISRTVDISSMSDKLGALTNFGLRVLYGDALAKLRTKQLLFGEMLEEVNHRLLVLEGITPSDGGKVVFGDVLPVSETEQIQVDAFELDNKLASRETIAKRRGLDYAQEQERIADDQAADDNIGAQALQNFNNGLFGGF